MDWLKNSCFDWLESRKKKTIGGFPREVVFGCHRGESHLR